MHLQQAPFLDRANLGTFLNERGLFGPGVEVGTHLGEYAEALLSMWRGRPLHCVDPWSNLPEYEDQVKTLWTPEGDVGDRELHKKLAMNRLAKFGRRVSFMPMTSYDASLVFGDKTLDFVYIDGNHKQEYVEQDLHLWWPKIKSGGIIAGHDIVCPGEQRGRDWGEHIQPALRSFIGNCFLTVYLIVETKSLPWSYYIIKP